MHGFMLLLFSLAGGLTLSGIVANFYRMVAKKPRSPAATAAYYGVMVVAGPSVLFENSTRSFRQKECTRIAYGFALLLACYWAFMLGLAVISLGYIIK
jgi:hypothetical protein